MAISNVQGEHKVFAWLQTFIRRKLRGIQTIFLQLLKLISKILCHVFIVIFGFWIQHFQKGGLGEMVRNPGHHDRRISPPPPLDFFLWGYIKDKVFSTPVPDITNLKARTTDAFATITERMLENTWREIDYRLDVSAQQKEHMLKCTDVL